MAFNLLLLLSIFMTIQ